MKNVFNTLHRGEKGFTMLEILVVVAIMGMLVAIIILNILDLTNEGEDEAKAIELHNVQTAIYAMMVKAGTAELDSSYDEIDELAEVEGVTATNPNTSVVYYLDDYLYGGSYPLKQAYDISLDGSVTVD